METILSLLLAAQAPNPHTLAQLIYQVSTIESVDPVLVTRIVIIESRGNPAAINYKTHDYGLMQIHLEAHPYIGLQCSLVPECNLRHGIKILKSYDRVCRYNVGTGKLTGNRLKNCLRYEDKLASI